MQILLEKTPLIRPNTDSIQTKMNNLLRNNSIFRESFLKKTDSSRIISNEKNEKFNKTIDEITNELQLLKTLNEEKSKSELQFLSSQMQLIQDS